MNTEEIFIVDKLPKPLSQEEFDELMEKVKDGDNDATEKILLHNIRLVLYQVYNRFNSINYDKKDLVSVGNIGLLNAIRTFDKTKNFTFSTYATRCIDNEIIRFVRKIKKDSEIDSVERAVSGTDEELTLKDLIVDDIDIEESYLNKETKLIIRRLIEELPFREREIIKMYFGFYNVTFGQKEIAQKLNVTQSAISRTITKILNQLKKQLERENIIEKQINLNNKTRRRTKTIYEYFNMYSRAEVQNALLKLTDEEKKIIFLKYGSDLDNPVTSSEWSVKASKKFYGSLINKMKKILNENIQEQSKQHVLQK